MEDNGGTILRLREVLEAEEIEHDILRKKCAIALEKCIELKKAISALKKIEGGDSFGDNNFISNTVGEAIVKFLLAEQRVCSGREIIEALEMGRVKTTSDSKNLATNIRTTLRYLMKTQRIKRVRRGYYSINGF